MSRAAVILAAGKGTRFRSELAKVLHPVAGRSMLRWVLEAIRPLDLDRIVVVIGHQAAAVTAEAAAAQLPGLITATQSEQLGTGHAVLQALPHLGDMDEILILPGDLPLIDTASLEALSASKVGHAAAMLTMTLTNPSGFGRVIRSEDNAIARIVEHRDASRSELEIDEVNTSIYAFDATVLADELTRLTTHNDQGEQYLTDVIAPISTAGGVAGATACAELYEGVEWQSEQQSLAGVNDRAQLALAGAVLRRRIVRAHQLAGVSVLDPSTTYIGPLVELAPDAVILPGTHLEGKTVVAGGAQVGPNSRLVDTRVDGGATVTYTVALGAHIGVGAMVGPFTYLRPGAVLQPRSKAGAYVEIKSSTVGEGSKVPHLSYIGDTTIGSNSNIGAATVTVNYDGYRKHRTVIGDNVRIGSDTMLVAPVKIGDNAYTGAGSVITSDVPDGALAVERTDQRTIPGYAERRRHREEA